MQNQFGSILLGMLFSVSVWAAVDINTATQSELEAQYGKNNNGAAANGSAWALGADYNLSKRTAAYFVYGNGDTGAADVDGWNLGVKHSF